MELWSLQCTAWLSLVILFLNTQLAQSAKKQWDPCKFSGYIGKRDGETWLELLKRASDAVKDEDLPKQYNERLDGVASTKKIILEKKKWYKKMPTGKRVKGKTEQKLLAKIYAGLSQYDGLMEQTRLNEIKWKKYVTNKTEQAVNTVMNDIRAFACLIKNDKFKSKSLRVKVSSKYEEGTIEAQEIYKTLHTFLDTSVEKLGKNKSNKGKNKKGKNKRKKQNKTGKGTNKRGKEKGNSKRGNKTEKDNSL